MCVYNCYMSKLGMHLTMKVWCDSFLRNMSDRIALPTVDLFTSELESVGPKWYDLGVFLGVSTHKLDVIGKYHGSEGTQRCLIELFKCFHSRTRPVTWNDIVDALTKMHNNYLAECICHKLVQTNSSLSPLSPSHSEEHNCEEAGSDSQGIDTVSEIHHKKRIYIDKIISNEFNKIITSFASLVLEIKLVLQKKSVPLHNLQVLLQEVYEIEPLSTDEATLDKVFSRMRQHYCFLNYRVFACLVDKFLSNKKSLQQLLVDYTNKLEKFKESDNKRSYETHKREERFVW